MGWRQELCREFGHPVPCGAISLASLYKRTSPEIGHIVPEGSKASAVCGYRVIREVSADDLSEPLGLDLNNRVTSRLYTFGVVNPVQSGDRIPIHLCLPPHSCASRLVDDGDAPGAVEKYALVEVEEWREQRQRDTIAVRYGI
jgi:hypothetical protein